MNSRSKKKMENNNSYKEDIIATRVGGLGSSDAKMVVKVGKTGQLNYQAQMRIGQMLGQCERRQVKTAAMALGDEIEQEMFNIIKSKYPTAVSNPYCKNESLSEDYGFDIFTHIDFEVETDEELMWFECKATKADTETTKRDYIEQLAWHYMIGYPKAEALKKTFKLFLVHYHTGVTEQFDADNMTIERIAEADVQPLMHPIFKGLDLIRKTISEGFTFTPDPDAEVDVSDLPEPIQNKCREIAEAVETIDRLTKMKDEFKTEIKRLMEEYGFTGTIKSGYFNVSYRRSYIRTSFDTKALEKDMPMIFHKYNNKQTEVESSVQIKTKIS